MAGLSYHNNTRTPRAFALYRGPASRDQLCNMVADTEEILDELRKVAAEMHGLLDPNRCHLCGRPCHTYDSELPPVCELERKLRDLGVEV